MAGYKINSDKSVAFLCTNDKHADKEIRETTPFTVAINRIKYLGITSAKQVDDVYDKNFKPPKEAIKDIRTQKNLPCSWIARINIEKWPSY